MGFVGNSSSPKDGLGICEVFLLKPHSDEMPTHFGRHSPDAFVQVGWKIISIGGVDVSDMCLDKYRKSGMKKQVLQDHQDHAGLVYLGMVLYLKIPFRWVGIRTFLHQITGKGTCISMNTAWLRCLVKISSNLTPGA